MRYKLYREIRGGKIVALSLGIPLPAQHLD